ncbi:MAG: T9SS type A sorting domain-containing protein [Bacteroidetes bacterium]|nr:T9SS type A sorting domain-containing protein [Bacteroidota bacterium]
MFKNLTIWISLCWISLISAQSIGDNFKLAYANLVHQGKSFEISLITSNEFENADQLDLYIIPQRGIKLYEVILRSENKFKEIEFYSASSDGYLYDAAMCTIDLTGLTPGEGSSFFQVLMKFNSEFVDYSEIEFYGEFRRNNRIVNYLKNSSAELASDYPNYYRVKINFYSAIDIGEKALFLQSQSEFSISPYLSIENNMLIDFWIMLNQEASSFLEIKNKQTDLVEYRLATNEFQILTAESDFHTEYIILPHFIPNDVWLHFSVLFSFDENKIKFYCNSKEFSEFKLPASLTENELIISFINSAEGSFWLDQFRILDYNEPIEVAFRNRHFSSFISENSEIKLQFTFNETTLADLNQSEFVLLNNAVLFSSDAPIFSRAPELNLRVMNNFYELTWKGGDYSNADIYIVEQAEGENGFIEVYSSDAENIKEKIYTFLSERIDNSEIIYFRIKQINKDGSVIYSSQLKVGQGELQEFIIGQNFPNPFNPTTQISIEVLHESDFEIVVYNLEGKEVSVLHKGFLSTGKYQFTFNGSDLPSGIYLFKAWSPNSSQTKKMILAK